MSNLTLDVNKLKSGYVSEKSLYDKDWLKDEAYLKFSFSTKLLFAAPMGLQVYQFLLAGNPAAKSHYASIAKYKWFSFVGALTYGLWAHFRLYDKWTLINREYPEPTQYQKTLKNEAKLFKLRNEKEKEYDSNKSELGIFENITYQQMYTLEPHVDLGIDRFQVVPDNLWRRDLPQDEDE